jgi:AmiR/NasT family two-component response regulator
VRSEAGKGQQIASRSRGEAAELREELTQMRHALESRAMIEQAKGIAMERYGLPAKVAWSWLVRTSQNRNVKVRYLAEELVNSVSQIAPTERRPPKDPVQGSPTKNPSA